MSPLASYLRHLIVTGLLLLVAKYKLPEAGAAQAADYLALAALGTITWLAVKYAPALAKHLGLLALICCLALPSCSQLSSTPLWFRVTDPESGLSGGYSSKAGITIEYHRPVKITPTK
jgi:hypothetical protein